MNNIKFIFSDSFGNKKDNRTRKKCFGKTAVTNVENFPRFGLSFQIKHCTCKLAYIFFVVIFIVDYFKVVTDKKFGVDGLIVSNTTVSRPFFINTGYRKEEGGLSGRPLKKLSTQVVGEMFQLTEGW